MTSDALIDHGQNFASRQAAHIRTRQPWRSGHYETQASVWLESG